MGKKERGGEERPTHGRWSYGTKGHLVGVPYLYQSTDPLVVREGYDRNTGVDTLGTGHLRLTRTCVGVTPLSLPGSRSPEERKYPVMRHRDLETGSGPKGVGYTDRRCYGPGDGTSLQ